jgi:hypothetical protein
LKQDSDGAFIVIWLKVDVAKLCLKVPEIKPLQPNFSSVARFEA